MLRGWDIVSNIIAQGEFDHMPIALSIKEDEDLGLLPFHFNPLWLQ